MSNCVEVRPCVATQKRCRREMCVCVSVRRVCWGEILMYVYKEKYVVICKECSCVETEILRENYLRESKGERYHQKACVSLFTPQIEKSSLGCIRVFFLHTLVLTRGWLSQLAILGEFQSCLI